MIQSDNMRGAAFMVAAMAGFALEDMTLKAAMHSIPVGEALMAFGFLGMCGFIALAVSRGQKVINPAIRSRVMLLRAAFEVMGRLGYTIAIALIPLSNASAILQATPLVVVGAASLLFGERVGWRRWLAVAIGFVGVLIILRPGLDGFDAASLWALVGMLGFAGRDLATRKAPPILSNFQLGIYGFAMLVPVGALILMVTGDPVVPNLKDTGLLVLAAAVGVLAYWSLTCAMRVGEISVVTPFRYIRLPFALVLGAAAFGERPDLAMVVGSVLIVGSGIYTLTQARRLPGVADEGVDPRLKR